MANKVTVMKVVATAPLRAWHWGITQYLEDPFASSRRQAFSLLLAMALIIVLSLAVVALVVAH